MQSYEAFVHFRKKLLFKQQIGILSSYSVKKESRGGQAGRKVVFPFLFRKPEKHCNKDILSRKNLIFKFLRFRRYKIRFYAKNVSSKLLNFSI